MAAWADVVDAAPAFAAAVQAAFDAHVHKVLATLRADGSPRVSGTEVRFRDGEVWLGMMLGSRKLADVRRDPRIAIHSATADAKLTLGDARIAGRAVEAPDARSHRRYSDDPAAGPAEFGLCSGSTSARPCSRASAAIRRITSRSSSGRRGRGCAGSSVPEGPAQACCYR